MTDLYQLTMAAGYVEHGEHENIQATFELFVRRLPSNRGFLVTAGLAEAVQYLQELAFTEAELNYLRKLPVFGSVSESFWNYLKDFSFRCDLWALPEGTICFAGEPILRIRGPIVEAQLVETYLLSVINFETLIATKAARCVAAARGREVVEFGTRRAHGPEAGLLAARASYIGGVVGTSNVEAGMRFGIPVLGTAAHAWTMAHDSEEEAFARYVETFPKGATLLIDTYDTHRGARRASVFREKLKGVRIDSGNIATLSKEVREILDQEDCKHAKIVASGDLNEYSITSLLDAGAPIDTFGVGTELVTSRDAPALGGVYKLVEQEREGKTEYRAKFSSEKATYPAAKQVYRFSAEDGTRSHDLICLADEPAPEGGTPLMVQVLEKGKLCTALSTIEEARARCSAELAKLPAGISALQNPASYSIRRSEALEQLFQKLKGRFV